MITIADQTITIKVNHPCPQELIKDIKNALIEVIQNQSCEYRTADEVQEVNWCLLEILKMII